MYLAGPPSALTNAANIASALAPPKVAQAIGVAQGIASNPTAGGVVSALVPALKLNKEAAAGLTLAQGIASGNPISAGLMALTSLVKVKKKGQLDPKTAQKWLEKWNAAELPPMDWDRWIADNPDTRKFIDDPKGKFQQLRAMTFPDMHNGEFYWRMGGWSDPGRPSPVPLQAAPPVPVTPSAAMPIEPLPIVPTTLPQALPGIVPQNVAAPAQQMPAPPSATPQIVVQMPAQPEKSNLEKWGVPLAMIAAALIGSGAFKE